MSWTDWTHDRSTLGHDADVRLSGRKREPDRIRSKLDNCSWVHNPAVSPAAFQTTTGGQLDDDADGYGNQCDADFNGVSGVDSTDLSWMKNANGELRKGSTCDPGGSSPCDVFDLDNASPAIDSADLAQFKLLFGKTKKAGDDVMEKCPNCGPPFDDPNLSCEGDHCP
jgi:hypothetical protein